MTEQERIIKLLEAAQVAAKDGDLVEAREYTYDALHYLNGELGPNG